MEKIHTEFNGEVDSWKNMKNGLVLSIEDRGLHSGDRFQVITLPENFEQDNQIIDIHAMVGNEPQAQGFAEVYRKANA